MRYFIFIDTLNTNIQFQFKANYCVNFLDISIKRQNEQFDISMYKQPTLTDVTIWLLILSHVNKHYTFHDSYSRCKKMKVILLNKLLLESHLMYIN